MHILFLTDNFPPEVNAPASRTHEHCREWVRTGHRVTVVTGVPNFPQGRVFPGYRNRCWQREWIDGIRVIRVWTYINANEGVVRRGLDYLSFMLSGTLAALFTRRVDVVVGTSPQLLTACAACLVGALKRRPYVFELRDLWPESIKAVGAMEDSALIALLERLEMFLYRRAARIVSVTHSFRETLGRRGVAIGKIDVVTNGVDIGRFSPRARDAELERRHGLAGYFVAGYVGTHGLAHALETLLYAAKRLQDEHPALRIRFLFLGDGARKAALVDEAARLGLANVVFVGSVPKDEVARYWSLLDVSIIHLRRTDLFTTVIPSKLFECMGMGIPVLLGVAGESAAIVEREAVGQVFEPENADQLVQMLLALSRNPTQLAGFRRRALDAARHYDRGVLAAQMLRSLEAASSAR